MHNSGRHTPKDDSPMFLLTPAYFYNHMSKTLHPSGVECKFIQPWSSLMKISHSGNRGLTSSMLTLRADSLMLMDGLSSSENPE